MTARPRERSSSETPSTASSGVRPLDTQVEPATEPRRCYLLVITDRSLAQDVAFAAHERGVEVHVALSGASGFELARERTFDAILLHGLLPDTDAIRWLSEASSRTRATPVVVMSSFRGILETARRCFAIAGAVEEPADAETLLAALQQAERSGVQAATEPASLVAARVDAAARAYAQTLTHKLDAIRAAWLAQANPETAEKLAHRLRGTAGCYGFDEVGSAAGALEDALVGRANDATLEAAFAALAAAVERALLRVRQS